MYKKRVEAINELQILIIISADTLRKISNNQKIWKCIMYKKRWISQLEAALPLIGSQKIKSQ